MNTKYLTSLMLLVAACSGGHTSEDPGGQTAQLKKEAAEASASGSAQGDVCGSNDWYGDGECDTFCRDADTTDCAPDCDGGVVCAAFSEEANGYCSRKAEDPCISQDPDCVGGTEPGDPGNPDEPIACAAISEVPDGVCGRAADDPCKSQDPDCTDGGGGSEPNPGPTPICKALPSPANGVCEREPNDPCLALDPDCVPQVACAEYIELSDGVCKRDPADPCIFQDPDCAAK